MEAVLALLMLPEQPGSTHIRSLCELVKYKRLVEINCLAFCRYGKFESEINCSFTWCFSDGVRGGELGTSARSSWQVSEMLTWRSRVF